MISVIDITQQSYILKNFLYAQCILSLERFIYLINEFSYPFHSLWMVKCFVTVPTCVDERMVKWFADVLLV